MKSWKWSALLVGYVPPVLLTRRRGAALDRIQFNVRSGDLFRAPIAFPGWKAIGFAASLDPSTTTTATGWAVV